MGKGLPNGIMGLDYHFGRKTKRSLIYRLNRRTLEVIKAIREHAQSPGSILDLGAADGLMLSKIKDEFPESNCLGVEYSQELINANKDKRVKIIQGDVLNLPSLIRNQKFDVIIAAALIEHLENPEKLAKVAHDRLKMSGILIVTTPDPFFEKIATRVGHLPKINHHQQVFSLRQLRRLFNKEGFRVLKSQKFMFSPVGFPCEERIERIMRRLRLDFLMVNQLLILKK